MKDDHLSGSIWFAVLVLGIVLGSFAWRTRIKPWLQYRRDMKNVREVMAAAKPMEFGVDWNCYSDIVRVRMYVHDTRALDGLLAMGRALDRIYPNTTTPNERTT